MSRQEAMLETLLGAAELKGNRIVAEQIRGALLRMSQVRQRNGYQRLSRAAIAEPRCALRKAA